MSCLDRLDSLPSVPDKHIDDNMDERPLLPPTLPSRPKLRHLDFRQISYQGRRMWLLRDPWQLSPQQLIVPAELAPLLLLCDGQHTLDEMRETLSMQLREEVPLEVIESALLHLDDAHLLQNERSESVRRDRQAAYRAQPYRIPALANLGYPAQPGDLATLLQSYGGGLSAKNGARSWNGRGVVSPHIDYQRGGSVYARVWHDAAPAVLSADLILVFGTDHNGGPGSVTLTHVPYATPFGVLPTDVAIVDSLASALGPEAAYREELNHVGEHSIELSAVWIHYLFHQAGISPCPVIPILVGSFHHFLADGHHPAQDARLEGFLETLHRATSGRRVLAVGSVDLAHVGPAFGDPFAMDSPRRALLTSTDQEIIMHATRGDAGAFYAAIASANDRHRICGFSPLYLMLRFLGPTTGTAVDYRHCPADEDDTSLVSICGLLLD